MRGLITAWRARSSTVSGSSRCSLAQSSDEPRPREPLAASGCSMYWALPAFSVRRDDEPPRESVRDPGPVVIPDDVQAQVQSGCCSGGGKDLAVVGVEDVGLDPDGWPSPGELAGVHPVSCDGAAVKQPGGGEDEGAGADGGNPRTTGIGGAQGLQGRFRHIVLLGGAARNDHRVRLAQLIQPERTVEEQPLGGADRPSWTAHNCSSYHQGTGMDHGCIGKYARWPGKIAGMSGYGFQVSASEFRHRHRAITRRGHPAQRTRHISASGSGRGRSVP